MAFYPEKLDAWYDEDEEIHGHLRDPFHRVDVRPTSRAVTVSAGSELIAESTRAMVLSETGLPNRIYIPIDDVRAGLLEPTATSPHCPYKGDASYWSLALGDHTFEDAAWGYEEPFDEARRVAGHVCFLHDHIETSMADG